MKTRDIIINSSFELFAEKKFSEISVQDIIDRARCSRFSFYKYFTDKYELMHLYYRSYVNDLLVNHYDGSNFVKVQAEIFQFIKDNESFFANVKDFNGPDSFWSFLTRYSTDFFTSVKCENHAQDRLNEEERIEMRFIVDGAVSVFRAYVELPGVTLSPLQISELLCRHYPRDYHCLPAEKLENFRCRFS